MLKAWVLMTTASCVMAMVPSGKSPYSSNRTGMIEEQGSSNDSKHDSSPSYHPTDMQILADNETGEVLIITTQYGPKKRALSTTAMGGSRRMVG